MKFRVTSQHSIHSTVDRQVANLAVIIIFSIPKKSSLKMVEAPADMASSDSDNMMEVEAPSNADGAAAEGASSGPPPRLMISKMVRFCSDE